MRDGQCFRLRATGAHDGASEVWLLSAGYGALIFAGFSDVSHVLSVTPALASASVREAGACSARQGATQLYFLLV